MKRFRMVYWLGTCITERYTTAKDEEEAKKKFFAIVGDWNRIISIERAI